MDQNLAQKLLSDFQCILQIELSGKNVFISDF
jgi:hypothetical protein